MTLRLIVCALAACTCWAASDAVAARLAREAHQAQNSGQLVRAYLLYAEAAARDPTNPSYRANREALAPIAQLLTKAQVESADVSADIATAEREGPTTEAEPPVEIAKRTEWEQAEKLAPAPQIQPSAGRHDFDIRADEKSLIEQVASAYGVRAICDPELQPKVNLRFQVTQADFRTAMEALTTLTDTFVFAVSEHVVFFARDTEAKRNDLEPNILLTFPLPDALEQKDLIDAANAVRGVVGLRAVGWDSANRTVMIRDRMTRARVGRSLLEALLLPKGQVSFEVQFMTLDSDRSYHYGASLPSTFQLVDFGHLGGFQSILPTFSNAMNFLAFGGGASLFGIGVTNATIFATYSNSFSRIIYDATVVVSDGQTASLHVGDKYPIPQTLYTGFQQTSGSIYNPIGQVTLEDLGLILKMSPHISGDGEVAFDVEADFKSLGTQTFNTVPSVNEREFKGSVRLKEGEWAIIAGLDATNRTVSRSGLAGLSDIPGLNQIFSENTRDTNTSKTLIVIKPTVTRLPMSSNISPQYLLGPMRGEKVLF